MLKDLGVKFVFVEVLIFVVLFIVGYQSSSEDPLFLHSSVNPMLLAMLVITLYYGFVYGILGFIIEITFVKLLYPVFPVKIILWHLLNIVISGEFHFFWTKKIETLQDKNAYFRDKLRRFASDSMILKLSHDQLEKHYLVKPISIRSLMERLKESILEDLDLLNADFNNKSKPFLILKQILEGAFYVQNGELYVFEEKKFVSILSIGSSEELDTQDPLVDKALESRDSPYISQINDSTKYLAVIPIYDFLNEDKLIGLFVLRKIPFHYLNADTVVSLGVILYWFLNELRRLRDYGYTGCVLPLSYDFCRELLILKCISNKLKEESVIVIFKLADNDDSFEFFLREKLRAIDVFDIYKSKTFTYFLILLPLSDFSSARGFIDRLRRDYSKFYGTEKDLPPYRVVLVDGNIEEKLLDLLSDKNGTYS